MTATGRAYTYQCTATATKSERGTWVRCTSRVTGFGEDLAIAEQDARDRAVLDGWGVNGDDWTSSEATGLRCPLHA